jgi:hypothetical protein
MASQEGCHFQRNQSGTGIGGLAGEMSGVQAEGLLVPPTRIERATNGLGILPSQTEPTQQEPTEAKSQESEKD